MLTPAEREYASALAALSRRDYIASLMHFDAAGGAFEKDAEFVLMRETVRTLLVVKSLRASEVPSRSPGDQMIGNR